MSRTDPIPTDEPTDSSDVSSGRRSKWRITAAVLVVLIVCWAIFATIKIRSAYQSARDAKALLEQFRDDNGGSFSGLEPLTKRPDLTKARSAEAKFGEVSQTLDSPLLAPVSVVPVIGRQLGVISTLSNSSQVLISSVVETFDDVSATLDSVRELPAERRVEARLDAAAKLQASLESLVDPLSDLETGTDKGLTAPVREARDDFIRNRDELVRALDRAIIAVKGTHAFLSGPNTYVVLAANNAEMRAGSGMFLQAGPLAISGGQFAMRDLSPTADMVLPEPVTSLEPDLQALWHDLRPGAEWRNINLTPRFPESGRMALDMWKAYSNSDANGVMAIDIPAVSRLLKVVGPVSITQPDGQQVELNAGNVSFYLLVQQYREISRQKGSEGQEERRSYLGEVAKAIFESFNSGNVSLEEMIDALVDVGRGRHLMAWSSDPVQQAAWKELGLSGDLPENGMLFSLINRGGNKLDQFVDISGKVSETSSGDRRHVTITLTVTNTTPDGLPDYMLGGDPRTGVGPGDYVGYFALNVPGGAGNPVVEGAELTATAPDGPTRVFIVSTTVPKGTTKQIAIGFDLLKSWKQIEVLPSARVPPVQWSFGTDEWTDAGSRRIRFKD